MVGFAAVPGAADEAAVITQNTGEVWKVFLSGAAPVKMGDLTPLMAASLASEEGLLGIAFSPSFQSNHHLYLYYTADDGCSANFSRCSVVSRFTVSGNSIDMGSAVEIMRVDQPYGNHNGGHLVFGPDGYLYVGLGDGGSAGDPQGHGQSPDLLGSIARVNVSGGGPFSPQVYAKGFRNPWRFSFDRQTGQLWAGDVGQNAWEEVDNVVSGGNYGWNIMEGFECYPAGSSCSSSGLRLPRAAYGHDLGCSITGGYVYRGSALPELRGWFVYADYCSGRIWAVNIADSSPAVLLADTDFSIASFGELPSGELVLLTFQNAIYRLVRA
jgi:glucose/arabinose dehydrogenase